MLDMTQMLRPFFWLMVGLTVLAPVAIAFARRSRTPPPDGSDFRPEHPASHAPAGFVLGKISRCESRRAAARWR
jgi:hypothetical protein